MRMMKKERILLFGKYSKLPSRKKKQRSRDIDENDEERKNIAFWKIFEIDIEGKKKLIKKCRSRGIDDSNAERKNTSFWKIFEIVIEEEKIN